MFRLRGHHLLCLVGYRGMGYSPEFTANMTRLHQSLRRDPHSQVLLVTGPDDLCAKFPRSQPYHCEDAHVHARDTAVLDQLGLQVGQCHSWNEIQQRIRENVAPHDVSSLCPTCPWRSYGVCEEGIAEIHAGKGLRKID